MPPQLIGPYRVLRELGRGGMGVVYEVEHPQAPDRRLALKTLLTQGVDPQELLRFQREAELLARIRHPHVVHVHDLGRHGPLAYLVMERVEGQSLQRALSREPLPLPEVVRVLEALGSAVDALHAQGIVHRDLKPQNVMLRPDGSPVLLDFGLARDLGGERLTQTGAALGTPQYMAPEQFDGIPSRIGPPADVYGLGAILYACLTGQPPFTGHAISLAHRVLNTAPAPPSRLRPDAVRLDAVCLRALSKSPAARPPSPGALAQALREALERRPPRDLRRPLALTVVAASVGLGVWLQRDRPAPPAPPDPVEAPAPAAPRALLTQDRAALLQAPPEDSPQRVRHYLAQRAWLADRDDPEVQAAAAELSRGRLLRIPRRTPDARFHTEIRADVGFAHDGRLLILYSGGSYYGPRLVAVDLDAPELTAVPLATSPEDALGAAVHSGLSVDPTGRWAAFVDKSQQAWRVDLDTGRVDTAPCPEPLTAVAVDAAGRLAVGAESGVFVFHDLASSPTHLPTPAGVCLLAFSPSGDALAYGYRRDDLSLIQSSTQSLTAHHGAVCVWSPERGVWFESYRDAPDALWFLEDRRLAVGTYEGYAGVFDLTDPGPDPDPQLLGPAQLALLPRAHDQRVDSLTGAGEDLLSACPRIPEVRRWDLGAPAAHRAIPTSGEVAELSLHPSGHVLAVGLIGGEVELLALDP